MRCVNINGSGVTTVNIRRIICLPIQKIYTKLLSRDIASGPEQHLRTTWKFVDDKDRHTEKQLQSEYWFWRIVRCHYTYNTDGKYYERTNGGVLQTNANTDATLTTRNIIVQHVPPGIYIEGRAHGHDRWESSGGSIYMQEQRHTAPWSTKSTGQHCWG